MFRSTSKPSSPFSSWRRLGIAGFVAIALAALIGMSIGIVFGEARGWITGGAALALGMVIRVSWPLRKEPWFWAAMSGLTALHVIAVAKFDWSWARSLNGRSFGGLFMSDTLAMLGIIYGLYRLIYGRPASAIREDPGDAPDYGDRDLTL